MRSTAALSPNEAHSLVCLQGSTHLHCQLSLWQDIKHLSDGAAGCHFGVHAVIDHVTLGQFPILNSANVSRLTSRCWR